MNNHVCGKILLKETGIGIPDLLIEVYNVEHHFKSEATISFIHGQDQQRLVNISQDFWQNFPADRLGSVTTDENGKFELVYEDSDFQHQEEEGKRPDLVVFVMAPEELEAAPCPQILHISCGIRQNAGRIENYIIKLTKAQLKEAGIELPSTVTQEPEKPEIILKQLQATAVWQQKIDTELKKIRIEQINQEQEVDRVITKNFQGFYKTLSTVPISLRHSNYYVTPDESIENKTTLAIKEGIQKKITHAQMVNYVSVTKEQIKALNFQDNGSNLRSNRAISSEKIESILFNKQPEASNNTILFRQNPLELICREQTLPDSCKNILDEHSSSEENHDSSETSSENSETNHNSEPAQPNFITGTEGDIVSSSISKLLQRMTAPEVIIANGKANHDLENEIPGRATQDQVQKSVNTLKFEKSPADVPAYYDFHNLQIAFEPVWQEAFDEGVLDIAQDAYREIVELGGKPPNPNENGFFKLLSWDINAVLRTQQEEPPATVISAFDITKQQWNALVKTQKQLLEIVSGQFLVDNLPSNLRLRLHQQGERIIRYADSKLAAGGDKFNHLHKLLQELEQRLKEPYAFTIYAANRQVRSINFGLVVTYRQKWEPMNYQAGELVKTITLAPKEVRKFSKKMVVKKKRSEKEVEKSMESRREEASNTSRAETEIVRKAQNKTNFNLTAEGGYSAAVWNVSGSTSFGKDVAAESAETKKDFHEAVRKASQEYKHERTLEVNTEEEFEFEVTESGEITNPNDEIPVTFLFYELQRQFNVSEEIHRVMPVVLVAQEVPKPHEIDEDWLVAHDWILKRVILDDSFLPALAYLSTRVVGDEFTLKELYKNLAQQRQLLDLLKEELVAVRQELDDRYAALEKSIEERANIVGGESTEGVAEKVWEFFGGSEDQESLEAARILEDAAKDAYEKAAREEKDMRARLEREVTALTATTEAYNKALSQHLNRKAQIARLRVHVKENILYYMQAIWNHEPPDQRFFRLHKVKVPKLQGEKTYTVTNTNVSDRNHFSSLPHLQLPLFEVVANCQLPTDLDDPEQFTTLAEVADLDNLIGYKGNYMVFPLKKSNDLTDFMMTPYLDPLVGLRDPDEWGNWTLEDFSKYICCLKEKLSSEEFDTIKEQLREQYQAILTSPRRSSEKIIVPTGSLFIEALPGKYPLLEDFKLMHRAIDVKKVQAEVRGEELENLRMAARLLTEEYEDPDIEKKIVIEGDNQGLIFPSE